VAKYQNAIACTKNRCSLPDFIQPSDNLSVELNISEHTANFRSVILAGERPGGSALSKAFNISSSVMVPVAGQPSLARVMRAVNESNLAEGGIICGPASDVVSKSKALKALLQQPEYEWSAPAAGPAASALSALDKLDHYPVLLTAGDHALLTAQIVDDFCSQVLTLATGQASDSTTDSVAAVKSGYDLVIGFVPYVLVNAAWPESKRTVLKFSNGKFCGSNLFAILNPDGRSALEFWRQAEADRKQPWRIARRFGMAALLRYLLRRLTLEDALQALSKAAGCRIGYVEVGFARAAIDVDSVEDQKLAERILSSSS
jgi:GTP:adenosylcobinamide-phosphate guanylyltransferase